MAPATKLTPEQEKFFVVNEDALTAAAQSTIGASHPSTVAQYRHFIENYLAAIKAEYEAPPEAGTKAGGGGERETRDQRNAREERESAERIRKAAEPKNKVPDDIAKPKPGPGR